MTTVYMTSEAMPTRFSSHALTKDLVARIAKAAKTGVYNVAYNASGKPYFTAGGRYLSVSHTGGRLFVAVSDCPVGLDAEVRREVPERVKREWLSESEQKQDFFEVWTAKEAVSKLVGEGLAVVRRVLVEKHVAMLDGKIYQLFREERDGTVITVASLGAVDPVWV